VRSDFPGSALDCIVGFSVMPIPDRMAIASGELRAGITGEVRSSDECTVIGRPMGIRGREHFGPRSDWRTSVTAGSLAFQSQENTQSPLFVRKIHSNRSLSGRASMAAAKRAVQPALLDGHIRLSIYMVVPQ
jgi:hypothetical protein